MGFLDEVKEKAGELGEKAKEGFEAARDKAEDLVGDIRKRFDHDDEVQPGNAATADTASGDASTNDVSGTDLSTRDVSTADVTGADIPSAGAAGAETVTELGANESVPDVSPSAWEPVSGSGSTAGSTPETTDQPAPLGGPAVPESASPVAAPTSDAVAEMTEAAPEIPEPITIDPGPTEDLRPGN